MEACDDPLRRRRPIRAPRSPRRAEAGRSSPSASAARWAGPDLLVPHRLTSDRFGERNDMGSGDTP
jgi:hypothetical protein